MGGTDKANNIGETNLLVGVGEISPLPTWNEGERGKGHNSWCKRARSAPSDAPEVKEAGFGHRGEKADTAGNVPPTPFSGEAPKTTI